jgi:hypothetical protein
MTKIKNNLLRLILVLCLSVLANGGSALAQPEDLGEICIEFIGGTFPLKLHVLAFSSDTFQLIGKIQTGEKHFMPVHGAAALEGNTGLKNVLKMTLSGSDSPAYSITYNFSIDLSKPHLLGGYTHIAIVQSIYENPYPGAPDFYTDIGSGSFRLIQCP